MNWTGFLFGLAAMVAVLGGSAAAFLRDTARAAGALAVALLGVAGVCFTLGHEFLAMVVAVVLAAAVPASTLAALALAPPPAPDVKAGSWAAARAVGAAVLAGAGLALLLARATWPPAGGARQIGAAWVGSRLLGDQLAVLVALAALLALAAVGAIAVLRARRARAPRAGSDGAP